MIKTLNRVLDGLFATQLAKASLGLKGTPWRDLTPEQKRDVRRLAGSTIARAREWREL